ncbi:fibronectin type III domain-containing protein [Sporotomaculum syntrophicum]|uniref:fibronectin type III domain-containing protein n=1 Tax=Sporotomaculum syntrophicum TaxID=182264 RepID=UPI003C6FB912
MVAERLAVGPYDMVTLTWKDNSDNESGYRIQGATNATFTNNLVTSIVDTNTTIFLTIIPRFTPYYFRIQAFSSAGESAWVNAQPFPIVTQ